MGFRDVFGHQPDSTWRAPGRVNLIGDHTDYNDGLVLPFAIAQSVTVNVATTDTGVLAMASAQFGATVERRPLDALRPNARSWTSYIEGVAWLLSTEGVVPPGLDIFVDSDIAVGAGLSSSAALTGATLCAALELGGEDWSWRRIAAAAQRVENEYVGAPVGIMDPMAVLLSSAGHAMLLDCRTRRFELIPLDLVASGCALVAFNTGSPHQTVGAVYTDRVAECRRAAVELGVESLRDVTDVSELAGLSASVLAARARHVVSENERTHAVGQLLGAGRVEAIGPLMTQSHESLRDDFEVSTPELDLIVSAAIAAGALGGRLTGAGMGGLAIVLCRFGDVSKVVDAVGVAFSDAGLPAPSRIDVTPSRGAERTPNRG